MKYTLNSYDFELANKNDNAFLSLKNDSGLFLQVRHLGRSIDIGGEYAYNCDINIKISSTIRASHIIELCDDAQFQKLLADCEGSEDEHSVDYASKFAEDYTYEENRNFVVIEASEFYQELKEENRSFVVIEASEFYQELKEEDKIKVGKSAEELQKLASDIDSDYIIKGADYFFENLE